MLGACSSGIAGLQQQMVPTWPTKLSTGQCQGRSLAMQASTVATSRAGLPDIHRHGSGSASSSAPPPPFSSPATHSGTHHQQGTNVGAPLRHKHPSRTQDTPAESSQSNLEKNMPRRRVATKKQLDASEMQLQQQAKQERLLQSIPVEDHPAALRDLQSRFLTEELKAAPSLTALASCLPHATLSSLNSIHVTAAYRRLAQLLKDRHNPSMRHEQQCLTSLHEKLDTLALKHCQHMRPRELSGVLWAAASSGHALHPQLLDALIQRLLHQFGACNEIDVSNVVWSLVTHLRSAASQAMEDMPAWRATLGPEELSSWKMPNPKGSSHPHQGSTGEGYFEAPPRPSQINLPGPGSNASSSEETEAASSIQDRSSADPSSGSSCEPSSEPSPILINPANPHEVTTPPAPEAPAGLQRLPPLSFARKAAPVTLRRPPLRGLVGTQPGTEQQQPPTAEFNSMSSALRLMPTAGAEQQQQLFNAQASRATPASEQQQVQQQHLYDRSSATASQTQCSLGKSTGLNSFTPALSTSDHLPPPVAHFTLYPPANPGALPRAPQQRPFQQPLDNSSSTLQSPVSMQLPQQSVNSSSTLQSPVSVQLPQQPLNSSSSTLQSPASVQLPQQHHAVSHRQHADTHRHHTGPHQLHRADLQHHLEPRQQQHASQADPTGPAAPSHHIHQHEDGHVLSFPNSLHTLSTPSTPTQLFVQSTTLGLHHNTPQPHQEAIPSLTPIATATSLAMSPPTPNTAWPSLPPSSSARKATTTTAAAAAAAAAAALAAYKPAATPASLTSSAPTLSQHPNLRHTTRPVEPTSLTARQHHAATPPGTPPNHTPPSVTTAHHQNTMPTPLTASRRPSLSSSPPWLPTLVHQVVCRLPTLPERPLMVVCNSLVKVPHALSPAQARAVMVHLQSRAHSFGAQDLANMLSSMARLSYRPSEAQMQGIATLVADRLPHFKGDEIALVLHAFVRLRYLPPVRLLQNVCRATSGQLSKCSVGHLALMTWAFSQLHWRPPGQWVELVVMEACEREQELQEQEMATLLYGLVTFCYKPEQPEMAVLVARTGYLIKRGRVTPWQLTAYITALVRLRQRVLPPFAKATLQACYLALPRFTNVGLAYMLWGVARLAVWRDDSKKRKRVSRLLWHVPPDWLRAVSNEVWSRLPTLCATSAPLILWALAKLHSCINRPSPAWMGQFWQVAVRLLPHMQPRGVVALLQSSIWLRYTPSSPILQEVLLFISIHDCQLPYGMHTHVRMLMHRMNKLRAQKHWAFQMKERGLLPPYSLLTAQRAKRRMLKRERNGTQHKAHLLAGLKQPSRNQQPHAQGPHAQGEQQQQQQGQPQWQLALGQQQQPHRNQQLAPRQQQQQERLQWQHTGVQERRQRQQLMRPSDHQGSLKEQQGGLQGPRQGRRQPQHRTQLQKATSKGYPGHTQLQKGTKKGSLQEQQRRQQAVVMRQAHAALKDLAAQVQQHVLRDQEQQHLQAELASGAHQHQQQAQYSQLAQHKQQKQRQHTQHQLEQQQRRQQRERPVLMRQVIASLAEVSSLLVTLQEQNWQQGQRQGLFRQQQQQQQRSASVVVSSSSSSSTQPSTHPVTAALSSTQQQQQQQQQHSDLSVDRALVLLHRTMAALKDPKGAGPKLEKQGSVEQLAALVPRIHGVMEHLQAGQTPLLTKPF